MFSSVDGKVWPLEDAGLCLGTGHETGIGGEGDPASGEQEKVLVSVPDEGALWLG